MLNMYLLPNPDGAPHRPYRHFRFLDRRNLKKATVSVAIMILIHGIIHIVILVIIGLGCSPCVLSLNETEVPPSYESEEGLIRWFLETFEQNGGKELINRIESGDAIEEGEFEELDRIFGLPCLIGGLRPNFDAIESPPRREYKPVSVCLKEDEDFPECSEDNTIKFVDKFEASGTEFRYLNSSGTAALQGVFWLNYDGDSGGSLLSYAKTREGGSLSRGYMLKSDDNISYRARAGGDRAFSFSGNNFVFKLMQFTDVRGLSVVCLVGRRTPRVQLPSQLSSNACLFFV